MALTIAGATTTAQQAPSAAPPPIETDAASHAARRAGSPDQDDWDAAAVAQFFGGGALALGLHEAGHVLTASAMGTNLGLRRVSFGPVPFFAITHDHVGARREYGISSSGFLMQHASSEWLLTRRPALRREHAPIAKGVLAFNVLASAAYGGAALARMGPYERDTRGMATSLRANERWIGALVLAPAVFDTVRYFRPEARWAAWASRGAKAGMVLLAFRAR
jgi:hypothetical protein